MNDPVPLYQASLIAEFEAEIKMLSDQVDRLTNENANLYNQNEFLRTMASAMAAANKSMDEAFKMLKFRVLDHSDNNKNRLQEWLKGKSIVELATWPKEEL